MLAALGVLTGHFGNVLTAWLLRWSRERKQERFTEALTLKFNGWIDTPPIDEAEVKKRRGEVASEVKSLSRSIFGKGLPVMVCPRPDTTTYPPIFCKWCHKDHKARTGKCGPCRDCHLPIDLWIGAQPTGIEG